MMKGLIRGVRRFVLGRTGMLLTSVLSANLAHADYGVIVEDNDLLVIDAEGSNAPEPYRSHLDAFGQTVSGCTVTHIGNGRVLTAAHCYSPSPRATPGSCSGLAIWWGNRGGRIPYMVSKCKKILYRALNKDQDIMVVAVDKIPPVFFAVAEGAPCSMESAITIFSHPHSRPLEWSGVCAVENWSGSSKGRFQFNHRCDTEWGSSGAAIFDHQTGQIIGVHNGGGDGWNYATCIASALGNTDS